MSSYGMGQRFNPHTLRIGINKNWDSKWYDEDMSQEKKENNQSSTNKNVKDFDEER